MKLPILKEFHTSDLTADCLMAVKLKHQGLIEAVLPSAMFRGLVAGEALSLLHLSGFQDGPLITVPLAIAAVEQMAVAEGRPITDAVDKAEIGKEVAKVVGLYGGRFADYFGRCKLIGTEVPVRCEIVVDKIPVQFASHLDLLFRRFDNELVVDDWKWWDEAPTAPFVSRNLQLAMYAYAMRHGEVLIDGEWITFGEWPTCRIIYLPNLKPYARNGADFRAGDLRTDDKIVRPVPFDASCERAILHEFSTRIRMWRAGFFPASPSPIGCMTCDSLKYCPQLSIDRSVHL